MIKITHKVVNFRGLVQYVGSWDACSGFKARSPDSQTLSIEPLDEVDRFVAHKAAESIEQPKKRRRNGN